MFRKLGVMMVIELWLFTALLSAFLLALSNVTARLSYNRHGGFWEVFYINNVAGFTFIIPILLVSIYYYGTPSTKEFLVSLGFGVLTSTFSTALFFYSIRECGAVITSLASLSVEPITATLLGALAVGESVGLRHIIAITLFPVVAYLLYRGGKNKKTFKSCGIKTFIGAFTGIWASITGVIFSYLSNIGLANNPVLFYFSGLLVSLVVFFPVVRKKTIGITTFKEVPRVLYVSSFLGVLAIVMKMVSLSYGVPGHTISIILLYPALTVPLSHLIKETNEPINKYTVLAVFLATLSGFLVGGS